MTKNVKHTQTHTHTHTHAGTYQNIMVADADGPAGEDFTYI